MLLVGTRAAVIDMNLPSADIFTPLLSLVAAIFKICSRSALAVMLDCEIAFWMDSLRRTPRSLVYPDKRRMSRNMKTLPEFIIPIAE